MIDYFALALTHGLLIVALLRLARREDLDVEQPAAAPGDPEETASAETRREARERRRRRA